MINRYDRNKTAKLLRQFAAGQITNDDLDDNLPRSEDSACLLYTSPSPRDQRGSRMPSSA